jgi:GWxTD domain-containing protein
MGCGRAAARGNILFADGLEALAVGDSATALARLEQAHFERPDDDRILFHLGRLRARSGTPEGRAAAVKALRDAVMRAPRNGAYREALGSVLHTQGYHHESIEALGRAVALDSTLGTAWATLGVELLQDYRDAFDSAGPRDATMRCFQRALAADPNDDDSRYRLGCLQLFGRGDVDAARALCAPVAARSGCETRFALLRVAIEQRARRPEAAAASLTRALDCMMPDDRAVWTGAGRLLPPDSLGVYKAYTQSQRDSVSEFYWWQHDPTPTTLVNERLIEHVARILEADFRFEPARRRRLGNETDRGFVFVRWGMPETMAEDAGSHVLKWTYPALDGDPMSFTFFDEYLNGDYRLVRRRAGDDFSQREPFDRAPERTSVDLGRAPQYWHMLAARFRAAHGHMALALVYEVHAEPDTKGIDLRAAAWRAAGQTAGSAAVAPAQAQFVRRAGGGLVGWVRLDVQPPAHEIALEITGTPSGAAPGWRAAARRPFEILAPNLNALEMSDLLPAYELRDEPGGVAAAASANRSTDLRVPSVEQKTMDLATAVVVPRVDSLITDGRLHVYFEIYPSRAALTEGRLLSVTYRVQVLPPAWSFAAQFRAVARREPRAEVESSFELQSRHDREPQSLSVDIHNLAAGFYALRIEVRDPVTEERTNRSLTFAIPPRNPAVSGE